MTAKPIFHTEDAWEWSYQFVTKDPVSGEVSPRSEWDYDELVIVFQLPGGTEVGRASLAAGTLAIVDHAARKVMVSIPRTGRPNAPISGQTTIHADGHGRKDGGEWKFLGRDTAVLMKGVAP